LGRLRGKNRKYPNDSQFFQPDQANQLSRVVSPGAADIFVDFNPGP
jgi:hypothetical protein